MDHGPSARHSSRRIRTNRRRVTACAGLLLLVAVVPATAFEPLPRSTPEERDMDPGALAAAFDAMEDLGYVRAMVVARDGFVVGEDFFSGEPSTMHQSRSATKSVTSLLVGIAIDLGYLRGLEERLVDHLPADLVPDDSAKGEIRIGHLLTMTSGLEWNEDADVVGWLYGDDPVRDILDRPLVAQPGTVYNYNTAASHLLSVVLTEATGMATRDFADAHLFGPLGITDYLWQVTGGYQNGGHGLWVRTEDLAKLGVLCINGGRWGDEQLVSRYWVNTSSYPHVRNFGAFGALTDIHYGYLWWLDRGTDYQIFTAWGWGGQFIFCVPALDLVVAVHTRYDVDGPLANQQEAAVLDVIVNQVLPATNDRRVFTVTGLAVPELEAVDDMTRDVMESHEIRHATVALVKDGRLVLAHGYTLDEPEVEPVEPTALFRSGSIGKALTSIVVHQLIEQGLLGYDTPVAATLGLEPLPGETVDPRLEEVIVDHLLTHTSGMYSEDNIYEVADTVADAVGAGPPPTADEVVSYIVGKPFRFDPETDWDYNNYGYMMLGMLLEQATGEGFVEYSLNHLFRATGVGRARMAHQLASELVPTEVDYDGLEGDPYRSPLELAVPAGGWVLAAPDLARVFSALFDDPDASGLVSQTTLDDMMEYPYPVCEDLGYARGWYGETLLPLMGLSMGSFSDPDDGLALYGHGGGGSGIANVAMWREDGIVFVMFSNKDPVAEIIDFPEITVWPEHDLWSTVGVSLDPVPPVPTEVWIPVVAEGEGAGGSMWRSDVGLLNRSALPNSVRLRAYAGSGSADLELELAPGEQRMVSNVMGELGLTGSAPLRVFSSEPLTVGSRTYNQAADGTFGQFLDGKPPTQGLQTGDSVVLMQLTENEAARCNIGVFNGWKRPAEVAVVLHDGDGALLDTVQIEVPPEETIQLNRPFLIEGGRSDVDSGYAVVTVNFGHHVSVYASVVDNGTNDPTTLPPKVRTGAPSQWVAAAAHADGANDSQWRTDLAVLNLSGSGTTVEVRFHGDDGETTSTSVDVADGEQVLLDDLVSRLGLEGTGAVEVTSAAPVLVTSRTYNADATGTFGQFLGGVGPTELAAAGDVRWLGQLVQNASFRTNTGLLNTGSSQAEVRLRLFDASAVELAVHAQSLAAGERLQLQEPFDRIAGRDDLDSGYATVEVLAGSGILCYASVVDNATNDPTTIPGLR